MKAVRMAFAMVFALMPAWAQCSLCRLAVEQDESLGTAFNKAILLMMIPALGVFAGVFVLAKRSRPKAFDAEGAKENAKDAKKKTSRLSGWS